MDHENNEEITQELHMIPILERTKKYKKNWLQHVSRMNPDIISQKNLQYHPKGKRRTGTPPKRLLDDIQLDAETNHMV